MAVIGLDIGGSTTRAARAEDGVVVAEAESGSANIAAVEVGEAGRRIAEAISAVGTDGVVAVCAGAAGADADDSVRTMHDLVAACVPGAAVGIVHDARLVLAAAGLDVGVAVISGTGSVAWGASADGQDARAGGWGHLLGDEGSAFQVALDAVRHGLHRMNRGEPVDALTSAMLDACGLTRPESLIDHVYARTERSAGGASISTDKRYWARHAGVVAALAERGDPAAGAVLDTAADALVALASTVLTRLAIPGPLVLGGGFVLHQPALAQRVRDRLPTTEIRLLDTAPVFGAVRLAQQLETSQLETAMAPAQPDPAWERA
ncbi:N-acetylglucosamine kinase [Pseudonocardia sp. TRM90224]|uniref:N-acetylglucosamine kinase n=1 Tax=Pseudonocardia sp. TRM90224 TaxID=2812678 RepID=UPI001E43E2D3|nr:BadF/BadG/BcrA/BcrD ATPase family protein [Pseudonocardia sp. TRM90224]